MAVIAQIAPHNTHHNNQTQDPTVSTETPKLNPEPAARESLLVNLTLSNSRSVARAKLWPIRPEANAQYSDAKWVIQAPLRRITRRSNSRFSLLFPEPTKNQRPRSTARFLVESEGGVKRKTQQSYPQPTSPK
jgi:hypothetical protein